MPIAINGSGTVTGISVGGLPDGIVDTDMIAANAVTAPKKGTGSVLQVVQVETTAFSTSTANSGDQTSQMISANITPSATSSKIWIQGMFHIGISSGPLRVGCRLFINDDFNVSRGNGANVDNRRYIGSSTIVQSNNDQQTINYSYIDSPNTTSSTKYGFTFLHGSGSSRTISLNRSEDNNNASYNHTGISTIILTEIAG
jgi:hypothetical protein